MKIIAARKVAEALMRIGVEEKHLFPRDEECALLSRDGIAELGDRFEQFLWDNSLEYVAEKWDCDDYASACRVMAAIDHAKWSKVECGLAFGECWFIGDDGGHAVNFAAHENEKGELEICLYEPQVAWSKDGKALVSLSEMPLSSVQRWLFASW